LSQNLAEELLEIKLQNIGIFALRSLSGNGESVPRVEVELYVERMELVSKSK
jgi:hypothetical protein